MKLYARDWKSKQSSGGTNPSGAPVQPTECNNGRHRRTVRNAGVTKWHLHRDRRQTIDETRDLYAIVDNGTSVYVDHSISLLTNAYLVKRVAISLPNGFRVTAKQCGPFKRRTDSAILRLAVSFCAWDSCKVDSTIRTLALLEGDMLLPQLTFC